MEEYNKEIENCQLKKCNTCLLEKQLNEFRIRKSRKYCNPICRECENKRNRSRHQKNRELLGKSFKPASERYNVLERDIQKGFKECSVCKITKNLSEFYISKYFNIFRAMCKTCSGHYSNNWKKENPEQRKQSIKKWRKEKSLNDINYKIKNCLRCRIWNALKKNKKGEFTKNKRTMELIGCTIEEFIIHIEKQFKPNMTWKNHGKKGWEIDHIIPLDSFDLSSLEEQPKAFHYTNCQPLWATTEIARQHGDFESIGNGNKSNKIISPIAP